MPGETSRRPEEKKSAYEAQRQARIAALETRKTEYETQREEIKRRKKQEEMHRKILLKLGLLGAPPVSRASVLQAERRKREEVKKVEESKKRKEAKTSLDLGLEQI